MKTRNRLSDRHLMKKGPGKHHDGDGLYLKVQLRRYGDGDERLTRSWILQYTRPGGGGQRETGLGAYPKIGLSQAREARDAALALLRQGVDPVDARRARAARREDWTFAEFADRFIDKHGAAWTGKQRGAWRSTLAEYIFPKLGKMRPADITVDHVLDALEPQWEARKETLWKVRGRVERILEAAAAARGDNAYTNPAAWSKLSWTLTRRKPRVEVRNVAAMDYRDVPAFMARLRAIETIPARALEMAILTASRSKEVRLMQWKEFDRRNNSWEIPEHKMKRRIAHGVPLCARAWAILDDMAALTRALTGAEPDPDAYVFSRRAGRPLGNSALLDCLRELGVAPEEATVHGFRSAFSSYSHDRTPELESTIELCLAHTKTSEVAAAYDRGRRFEVRRTIMDAWADHCGRIEPLRVERVA